MTKRIEKTNDKPVLKRIKRQSLICVYRINKPLAKNIRNRTPMWIRYQFQKKTLMMKKVNLPIRSNIENKKLILKGILDRKHLFM